VDQPPHGAVFLTKPSAISRQPWGKATGASALKQLLIAEC